MDAVILPVEAATFDTLCDGRLSRQLDRALAEVADAFDDLALQEGRTELEGKIVITLELTHKIDSGNTHLTGSTKVSVPGLRSVSGTAMLRGGKFLVEPDRQMELGLDRAERGPRS